jgi:hypothetical protein
MAPSERRQVEALRTVLQDGDGKALRRRLDADRAKYIAPQMGDHLMLGEVYCTCPSFRT